MTNIKVVINTCHGGFGLSPEAKALYATKKGVEEDSFIDEDLDRTDPVLIEVVGELKDRANGMFANLEVFSTPKGLPFTIDEYVGREWLI